VCLAIFEIADIYEQHVNIKFFFQLGETFMETQEMINNFHGDQCMGRTCCYELFKRFKDGWQSIHDEPCLGWPSESCDDAHVAQVREIMHSNHRLTMREIAEECNISNRIMS
jgi:hypothetical protein